MSNSSDKKLKTEHVKPTRYWCTQEGTLSTIYKDSGKNKEVKSGAVLIQSDIPDVSIMPVGITRSEWEMKKGGYKFLLNLKGKTFGFECADMPDGQKSVKPTENKLWVIDKIAIPIEKYVSSLRKRVRLSKNYQFDSKEELQLAIAVIEGGLKVFNGHGLRCVWGDYKGGSSVEFTKNFWKQVERKEIFL